MVKGNTSLSLLAIAFGWTSSTGLAQTAQGVADETDETVAPSQVEPASSQAEKLQDEEGDDGDDSSQDIDERFETEGYVGGYLALLQQTVPTVGFTGSLFLDDDLRLGIDISVGNSEKIFGSFKTRGAAL